MVIPKMLRKVETYNGGNHEDSTDMLLPLKNIIVIDGMAIHLKWAIYDFDFHHENQMVCNPFWICNPLQVSMIILKKATPMSKVEVTL